MSEGSAVGPGRVTLIPERRGRQGAPPMTSANSRTASQTAFAGRLSRNLIPRHACFLLLTVAAVAWFWRPLATVVSLSLQHGRYEHYSHIILIPLISLFLFYTNRRGIFATVEYTPWPGVFLIAIGVAWSWFTSGLGPDKQAYLSPAILSMVTACLGAFLLCYGTQAFRKASFGLLLLLFMVPIPPFLLQAIIGFLQRASTEATGLLFGLLDVPAFRQGFVFVLPAITIEVTQPCIGIRSGLALLITSLVAGHLFLGSTWTKLTLVLAIVPLTIVKNAVRIVVLSLLASYVHPSFITDSVLHRNGGIPLFFVSLGALVAIVWLLRRFEARLGYRG